MTLDNGKKLVRNVLHNSYWKYKQQHFKKQNPLPCLLGVGLEERRMERTLLRDISKEAHFDFNVEPPQS